MRMIGIDMRIINKIRDTCEAQTEMDTEQVEAKMSSILSIVSTKRHDPEQDPKTGVQMTTKKTPSPPEGSYIVQDLEKIAVKKNLLNL